MIGNLGKETIITIGVSACLLGEKVRYDGGHKGDRYITDTLGRYCQLVPVCPEVELGMGAPREAVRLEGMPDAPRMVGIESGTDWTTRMNRFSRKHVSQFKPLLLAGYILKEGSPSCGLKRVPVFRGRGKSWRNGRGLYAAALLERYPLLPVEEESRLCDIRVRENFIVRIFACSRLQQLLRHFSLNRLIRFHTAHKYLLQAHSPGHYKILEQLVSGAKSYRPATLRQQYSSIFMEALRYKTTISKNIRVLRAILRELRSYLSAAEKEDISRVIEDYRRQLVPLVVPIALLRHRVNIHKIDGLCDQVYLDPPPAELMLRNYA
ncbi:MAG: DUF1722 domain-containing protein [candidate division Zixibacteria bacterium]|nr:DUF1722 domain-containing protein [candidate division Zixibacteria bacterium]